MSSVSVSNCIKFYQTAEDIGAEELRKYCEEIITSHWVYKFFPWYILKFFSILGKFFLGLGLVRIRSLIYFLVHFLLDSLI